MNTSNRALILLALAAFGLAACNQQPERTAGPNAGADQGTPMEDGKHTNEQELTGQWTLSDMEGTMLHGGIELPTLEVGEDGSVSGFAGVNRFTGRLASEEPTLFGPLATTRKAGPRAAMELETRFLAHLQQATGWRMESGELVLSGGDTELARFRPASD